MFFIFKIYTCTLSHYILFSAKVTFVGFTVIFSMFYSDFYFLYSVTDRIFTHHYYCFGFWLPIFYIKKISTVMKQLFHKKDRANVLFCCSTYLQYSQNIHQRFEFGKGAQHPLLFHNQTEQIFSFYFVNKYPF